VQVFFQAHMLLDLVWEGLAVLGAEGRGFRGQLGKGAAHVAKRGEYILQADLFLSPHHKKWNRS